MSFREVTYYQAVCDWPDCDATAHEATDYAAWGEAHQAEEDVDNANWLRGARLADVWYCENHPATWAGDHENGEPFPEPPYLLIHDGDTDDTDDDGKVSLIEGSA